MSKNISHLSGRKGIKNNLFEQMTRFGELGRTPSTDESAIIAKEYFVGQSTLHGTTTFYDFLKAENMGKKAFVCNGSACLCAGTQTQVKLELAKQISEDEIGTITCLGRCHENSSFQYAGRNYSGEAINHFAEIKNNAESFQADKYNVSHLGAYPLLTAEFHDIDAIAAQVRKFLAQPAESLLTEIKISNLRGRGGAGFPAGFKWETCRNTKSDEKYVVCNADEGDPGAYSDRYIMEHQPYRMLFGMMVAGYIADAQYGVVYIRAEYPESIEETANAITALEKAGMLGENIQGSGFSFQFKIIKGAGAYICGEETALLASIEGRRPEVNIRPPFPAVEGLFSKPTIVNNVETFAAVPALLEMGGTEFAKIGNGRSTGTKLVSLDGFFNKPGIYEVPMGTPLKEVIDNLGGGFKQNIKALHIGGPLGGLVPVSKIADLTVDFESFAQQGFLLGHASMVCIPETFPIVEYIEHLFEFTADESCGKCFPCRLGSTRGKEMVGRALHGAEKMDKALLEDLLETMTLGSLCALGGGLPLPIKNALQYFADELQPFFREGR